MNKNRSIDKLTNKSAFVKSVKERLSTNLFNKLRGMKKEVAQTLFPKKKD